jgi:hypothetical protein
MGVGALLGRAASDVRLCGCHATPNCPAPSLNLTALPYTAPPLLTVPPPLPLYLCCHAASGPDGAPDPAAAPPSEGVITGDATLVGDHTLEKCLGSALLPLSETIMTTLRSSKCVLQLHPPPKAPDQPSILLSALYVPGGVGVPSSLRFMHSPLLLRV